MTQMKVSMGFVTACAGTACLLVACAASPKPTPSPSATASLAATAVPSPTATPSSATTPTSSQPPSGPPVITALCAPNSTEFAWQVSTSDTGLADYSVDVSFNASATFPVEETSATQPYTFDTPNGGANSLIQARWDSYPSLVSNGTEADPYPCVAPTLTLTTSCASRGALPDGDVAFTGGVEGMLFEIYGPETHGTFPSYGSVPTGAPGGGDDGSVGAGSYEYSYDAPGSQTHTIDGSFTIG